jgi:hypothetical protein
MSATVTSLPHSTLAGGGDATPDFSCRLVYLHFMWGSASPPFSRAQGSPSSLLCVFFQLLVYYSVFVVVVVVFCGVGVSLSRGLCCFIPEVAVGVPHATYLLTCWYASPKQVRSQCLVAWSPPVFSVYHGMGKLCAGWWCGGFGVLLPLGGFSCQMCLQCLSKIFTLRNTH